MRRTFIEKLSEYARKDPSVVLIVEDVGFSFIEDFAAEFPKQFYNLGVTEQSAMGIVAGMALSGLKPYIYSMIPFVTMRNYEQLRNDVCYHDANVKVIGVQGSKHYKFLGFSHNISPDEDKQILSHLPNLRQYYPTFPKDVLRCMELMQESKHPAYMRL